mgnify:FL=1
MLVFTLGGIEVTARVQPNAPAERDKPFRFEVNLAKAKLFDAESGMRN